MTATPDMRVKCDVLGEVEHWHAHCERDGCLWSRELTCRATGVGMIATEAVPQFDAMITAARAHVISHREAS